MGFNEITLLFLILTISNLSFRQDYLLPNEIEIYSFEIQKGKKLMLAKDKNDEYIIYRFGTKNKIELEFPNKTKESWNRFKYSYWLRGGGITNEGIDLNYIAFINNEYKYIIYNTYYATGNKTSVGIKVINLKTSKIADIKGIKKTQKGTLVDFRDNRLLKIDDQLYD